MNRISVLFSILSIGLLTACSSEKKKVFVMASGKISVSGNTVTLSPGTTHNELTLDPDGDSVVVVTPDGTSGYAVPSGGLFLLNLKKDTLVGGYQRVGTDLSRKTISQDDLFQRMDSLNKLMMGQNVSETNRNYYLEPFSIEKISDNTGAQLVGPFRKLPGSFDPNKEHEVYKFYTNNEVREIIANVERMLKR